MRNVMILAAALAMTCGCISYKCNQYTVNTRLDGDAQPTITQTVTGDASLEAANELNPALKASVDGNTVKDNTATIPLQ